MKIACPEIRTTVIDGFKQNKFTQVEAARVTGYSRSTINRWCRNEEYTSKKRGHRTPAFSEEEKEQLRAFIESNPDVTLEDIKQHFQKDCSLSTIFNTIKRFQITGKKGQYRRKRS